MSNPLRFTILGCGAIARKHIAALERLDGAELVGVCDIDQQAAERLGQETSRPSFTDPRQMIAQTGAEVLSVLTPSGLHARNVLDLIDTGVHFVVEKPLALRLDMADEIIRGCAERNKKLFVVQQNRLNPPIQALKRALDEGRFGKLVLGAVRVRWCRTQEYYEAKPWRGTWALDGGVATNQASHHIDMLEWLLGQVESVMAMTETRLAKIEAEDTAVALFRFTCGALGVVEATTATRPSDLEGSLSILGEKGSVEVGGFFMNQLKTWQFAEQRPEDETIFETHGANPDLFAWNHTEYLRDVIKAIQTGGKGLVEGLEGRRSLELITAIYESAETEQEVHLRFRPRRARLGLGGNERQDR
ncbi:MAG: Gfo/Idh/MocA family oxidoreductase [Deltaproteobacteria bacterium]|nr:Gfo/Idh/MocA family oxidoreductase [Deltaproteobacteria bacterium]